MKNYSKWLCIGFVLSAPLVGLTQATRSHDVYLSPEGSDDAEGTREAPYQSLERARDALRTIGAIDRSVILLPGRYHRTATFELGPRDSGSPEHPVVYRADRPGTAFIDGGVTVPASAVEQVSDPGIRSRLLEGTRNRIRQIDLRDRGITDYGTFGPRGFRRAYTPAPLELSIDGRPQTIARWPNRGEKHILMGKVTEMGSHPRVGDYSMKPGSFKYVTPRAERWTKATDLYLSGLFAYGYADDTLRVASIDVANGTFTTVLPHLYGFRNQTFTTWYALNLIEEIDQPGEYCVDRESGLLLFLPPEDFDASSDIQLSMMEEVMVAMEGCAHIRFENLIFENARGSAVYIEEGEGNTLAGCTFRNLGILAVQMGQGIEPFPYGQHDACGNKADGKPGVPASRVMGSWHEHIYRFTAWNRKAGRNHRVLSCDIHHTGAGGIMLGGGDRKTLAPGNNTVENCDIYQVNRLERTYKAPVNVDGVGNRILNNRIHDTEGMGIYLHGNDHLIEFNRIYNVLTDMSDQGAIYMGRDPSESGTVIRHNFFYDIVNRHQGGHGVQAIFFDDMCTFGATITGNVFLRAGNTGVVKFNGGGESPIINNIMIDCPKGLQCNGVETATRRVREFMKGELGQQRLREHVDIITPPYSTAYPVVAEVYYHKRKVTFPYERNYEVRNDYSQFVAPSEGDYQLKEDADVYRSIPGFAPIPFGRMGLYVDEYRDALPVKPPRLETGVGTRFRLSSRVALVPPKHAAGIVYTTDGKTPTLKSTRYTSPLTVNDSVVVTARAVSKGDAPTLSEPAVFELTRIEATPMREARINFQTDDEPKTEGYAVDTGAAFREREAGGAYGWSGDNREAARRRGKNPDPLRDTLVHFSRDVEWEAAVDNGDYHLTICVGDAEFPCENQTIFVEGKPFCSGLSLDAGAFKEITKRVTVRDGILTLRSNNAPHGAGLTRMNYLHLKPVR